MSSPISSSINSTVASFQSAVEFSTISKPTYFSSSAAIRGLQPRQLNISAGRNVPYNPYNLPTSSDTFKFRPGQEFLAKAKIAEFLAPQSGTQQLSAPDPALQHFERCEKKLAADVHKSADARKFFLAFSQSIMQLFDAYYGKEAEIKLKEALTFNRTNQSGGVSVDKNSFIKYYQAVNEGQQEDKAETEAKAKALQMIMDTPLRLLGSSIFQTVATDNNKKYVLYPFKGIADEIKANPGSNVEKEIRKKYGHLVNIDFFFALCKKCGVDNEGLPLIEPQRANLYKKEDDGCDIRVMVSEETFQESSGKYSFNELKGLTSEERLLIIREQKLREDISNDAKEIVIKSGGTSFRMVPGTNYLSNFEKNHRTATAATSGSSFYLGLVAELLWPALTKNLDGLEVKEDHARLLLTTSMGYLYGEQGKYDESGQRPFAHHHSMPETIEGLEDVDKFIAEIIAEMQKANSSIAETHNFGFEELGKQVLEEMTAESKPAQIYNHAASLA